MTIYIWLKTNIHEHFSFYRVAIRSCGLNSHISKLRSMAEKDAIRSALSDEDILEKYHESRKANMKLLEQRREMLLELQRARDGRQTDQHLSEKCEQLQKRVDELEGKLVEARKDEVSVAWFFYLMLLNCALSIMLSFTDLLPYEQRSLVVP